MQNPVQTLRSIVRVDGGLLGSKRVQIALLLAFVVITAGCVGGSSDDTAGDDDIDDGAADDPDDGEASDDTASDDDAGNGETDETDETGDGPGIGTGDASSEDSVPADVDGVMFFDGAFTTDQATTELMDGLIALDDDLDPDDPQSWEEVLQEAEDESGFDVNDFHSATMFFQLDEDIDADTEEEYAGVIIESNWDWDDFVDTADEEFDEFESETYNGVTVYFDPDEEAWFADLGDGTFVAGTEEAVQDVIDTRAGDAEPFSGELRDAYDNAGDGLMKAAIDFTDPELGEQEQGLPEVSIMTMTYSTEGSQMSLNMGLTVPTDQDAEELAGTANFALSAFAEDPEFQELAENIAIGTENNRVTFEYVTTTDDILEFFQALDELDQTGDGDFNSVQSPALAG